MTLPPDELEEAITELENSDSDRPSAEITIVTGGKESLIPKLPNTKLGQIVIGLVACAAIAKIIWEILKL